MSESSGDLTAGRLEAKPAFRPKAIELLLLLASCVVACVLIDFFHARLLAACLLAGVVGRVLWQWAGLNGWGVLLWCVAMVTDYAAICEQAAIPVPGVGATGVLQSIGVWAFLVAMIVFLVAAVRHREGRLRNLGGVALVIASVIFWGVQAMAFHWRVANLDAIEHTTQNLIDLHRLGNEVESFRAEHGRPPSGEEEFVAWRGEPMPFHYREYRFNYYGARDNHYYISHLGNNFWGRHWDFFGYDVFYYGPTRTQRIRSRPW